MRDGGRTVRFRALIVALTLLASAALASQAQAATYTVGTTSDTAPATPCTPSSGTCSLRQLVEYENGLAPSMTATDTISVPAGEYDLSNGALTVAQSITVAGAGARTTKIVQKKTERVFDVHLLANNSPPAVTISGLEMTGGTANSTNNFYGGDLRNQGTLTLSEDWITGGNTSFGSGAGISNDAGTLTVTHSVVSGNGSTSTNDSAGIQNVGNSTTPAILHVDNSTIDGNTSSLGGGITSGGNNSNTVSIVNSTIAHNDGGARTDLTNSGGLLVFAGSISVENSIVAFNTVDHPSTGTASNCGRSGNGTITSSGYNLETGTDCGFTQLTDLQSTDPQFTSTAPQNNGGNTDTLGVPQTSPAVDTIPPTAPNCGGTDQRDIPRPKGQEDCDMGAYEYLPTIQASEGSQFSGQLAKLKACFVTSATVDWGDGTPSTPGTTNSQQGTVSGSHTYAEEGIYSVKLSYSGDCGTNSYVLQAQVADAPLQNATGNSLNAGAGQSFSDQVATFTDADPNGAASDYSATINWGDGTSSAGTVTGPSPFVINGTHTYASGGSYPVSVSISDVGGAKTTATGTATVAPQTSPAVTSGAPSVTGTTSAAFSATVNPEGLATSVVFEYGPALPAARDVQHVLARASLPFSYSSSTAAQTVGPDFVNHTVTATVTGLLPNTTYHVRVVATNSAGSTTGPDQTLNTPADPPPPPPVLGKSVDAGVVSGLVLVKLPGNKPLYAADAGAHAASTLTKGTGFVPLTEPRQLPVGTQVDARLGTISLKAAASTKHGKLQTGTFNGGLFKLSQDRKGLNKGLTTLSLLEGLFPGAPSYASCKAKKAGDASPFASAASSTVLQALHASAHGKFRTRGRYSAATVRGTVWGERDRCDGSLTIVRRGTVQVTDFVRHVTVVVRAGHSYLARAPGRRK